MNDTSRRLLNQARHLGSLYASNPEVRAVAVVGSVSRGQADAHSDTDIIVFYNELPSQEDLAQARERGDARGDGAFPSYPPMDGWVEAFRVGEARYELAHCTAANWERVMDDVLVGFDTDSWKQVQVSSVLTAVPLHGGPLIERWRARVTAYPDGLVKAMVWRHLRLPPLPPRWAMVQAAARGDTLLLHRDLVAATESLLGILMGLNRLYHPAEFKHMGRLLGGMCVAPSDLSARINILLRVEPTEALAQLERMVLETLALVNERLPDVDTAGGMEHW